MRFHKSRYFTGILTAVLLSFCTYSFSQKATPYKKKRFTFHIEKPDTSIAFDVYAVNPKVTASESSFYSWYSSDGKILETKGAFSGRLLDGRYILFYANKNIRERGTYVKGRKEGKWMKWNPDGKINEVCYWRMGQKQGKYVLYNDMGQKMLLGHFKRDKLNGTVITYEKDKPLLRTKYRNGKEVPIKIPKDRSKSKSGKDNSKPSFLKSIFKKKDKDSKPAKESKKKSVSMSSNQ